MAWHGIVDSHPWNSGTIAKWNNLFSVIYNPVGFGTKYVVYSNSEHMFDRSFVRTSSALFCLPERPLSRPTKDFWKIFKSTMKQVVIVVQGRTYVLVMLESVKKYCIHQGIKMNFRLLWIDSSAYRLVMVLVYLLERLISHSSLLDEPFLYIFHNDLSMFRYQCRIYLGYWPAQVVKPKILRWFSYSSFPYNCKQLAGIVCFCRQLWLLIPACKYC